ncbi:MULTISPECIES: ribosome silencing factor [Chromobacterium]|uniref:Ribosomal silencing factor RsfS n=4 Tax=Chromobacterium TaxID=535 RepID=A0ABS3GHJ0_9NEIS|nr:MULTISPECIES: ribosome silencing factor [Chromobacterium]AXT48573.1 ribosome silencing factor [Chromobacterium rhizoryzae]KMN83271.1 ribosomal silencing factor RsfS [Chromobacterium sp. LK11]MBK0412962.1 ribosome silencing factor [Chromobacterium haemolyticum]MBN3002130.1 ribosome silencing factor [Chromobacterium alkanivorans]MBO0414064.1 ribosome silencing factor [Chromobacterium haemolyticum]
MEVQDIAKLAIEALEDVKGKDIIELDTSKLTSLFQCMIVATGDSNRQVKALANSVHVKLKEAGVDIVGSEGHESGEWVLVDAGDVVVHVMLPAVRDYYDIEALWGGQKPSFLPAGGRPWSAT